MANQEQRDELDALMHFYEGSEDVQLRLPDVDGPMLIEDVCLTATVALEDASGARLDLTVRLPLGYPSQEPSACAPSFQLASSSLTRPQLQEACKGLDELLDESGGGPIVLTWIEWLRLDCGGHLASAGSNDDGEPDARVAGWASEALRDRTSSDLRETAGGSGPAAVCANCHCALDEDSADTAGWRCEHRMCRKCLAAVAQVCHRNGRRPGCPSPHCFALLKEETLPDGPEVAWTVVSAHLRGTAFEEAMVYCPSCEDRGLDIPVMLQGASLDALEDPRCACPRCSHLFCSICRSPWHSGSCFDNDSRVVRMAKRRPPITSELAEMAAKIALEVAEREKERAKKLRKAMESMGDDCFEQLREVFISLHHDKIMQGLEGVICDAKLIPTKLGEEVKTRFMRARLEAPDAELRPAFHGTDLKNHPSICARGLLVPGEDNNDISVVHGQAHGRGVYTANVDAAWLSYGFCSNPVMFVCAVLQSSEVIRHVGDAMVVARCDHVVPLFEAAGLERSWAPPVAPVNFNFGRILGSKPSVTGPGRPGSGPKAKAKPAAKQKAPAPAKVAAPASGKQNKFLQRLSKKSKGH